MKKYLGLLLLFTLATFVFAENNCDSLLGDALLSCMHEQQSQLDSLKEQLDRLEQQLDTAHTRISELEDSDAAKKGEIAALTEQIQEQSTAFLEAKTRIAELKSGLQFYPHPCPNNVCQDGVAYVWDAIVDNQERREAVSLQLEETKAQYAIATVFATMKLPETYPEDYLFKGTDQVTYIFGKNLPIGVEYLHYVYRDGFNTPRFFLNNLEHGDYAAFTFSGDDAGNDMYGKHGLLIIPLNEQQQMEAILAQSYNHGEHHVYLRVFGYLE